MGSEIAEAQRKASAVTGWMANATKTTAAARSDPTHRRAAAHKSRHTVRWASRTAKWNQKASGPLILWTSHREMKKSGL